MLFDKHRLANRTMKQAGCAKSVSTYRTCLKCEFLVGMLREELRLIGK